MAKRQKTFLLPTDVLEWLAETEQETGIPQTRLLVSGIVALTQEAITPLTRHAGVALEIEKGKRSLWEWVALRTGQDIAIIEGLTEKPPEALKSTCADLYARLERAKKHLQMSKESQKKR